MDTPPINLTDVAVVVVIVISGLLAFFRGLVHEVLAVISWIGAAMATLYGFSYARPYATELITVPLIADMVAGTSIFLVTLVVLSLLTNFVSRRIRSSALGPLDRSLGLVFGFLRGAALIAVAWLLFTMLLPREDHPAWITEAKVRPLVERGTVLLVSILPKRLRGELGEEPGYNTRERNEMRRAIEGIGGTGEESQ
jgi:membrane protein required for colicin V production